jgi:pantoate--beta-alanine ligase
VRTIRTVAEMRAYVARARGQGRSIGLVPTMGAFHRGHHSLMRTARERCDEVIVSLFVNPAQFNEPADLAAYPRSEERDAAEAAELGVDVLWVPSVEEVYPPEFATSITVAGLADVLEGAERGPSHFAGVCTVVAKLLNVVTPDVAFFGQKDAQQVAVLRRMVRDLDLPVELAIIPTVREPDGLAMSSRNAYLDADERRAATVLSRALQEAAREVIDGERDADTVRRLITGLVATEPKVELDYAEVVDAAELAPITEIDGDVLVAVAAQVGRARLIDNITLSVGSSGVDADLGVVAQESEV